MDRDGWMTGILDPTGDLLCPLNVASRRRRKVSNAQEAGFCGWLGEGVMTGPLLPFPIGPRAVRLRQEPSFVARLRKRKPSAPQPSTRLRVGPRPEPYIYRTFGPLTSGHISDKESSLFNLGFRVAIVNVFEKGYL